MLLADTGMWRNAITKKSYEETHRQKAETAVELSGRRSSSKDAINFLGLLFSIRNMWKEFISIMIYAPCYILSVVNLIKIKFKTCPHSESVLGTYEP